MNKTRNVMIMLLSIMAIAGCTPADRTSVRQLFGEPAPAQPAPSRVPLVYRGPIYCYDTIANPNCFAEPFPRMDERFVGAYISNSDYPDHDGRGTADRGPAGGGVSDNPGASPDGGARF